MPNKILLFTLFYVYLFSNIAGQNYFKEGYIITLEKDTVRGEVANQSNALNNKSCQFKSPQGENEYLPTQIAGYGYVDDKFYASQIVDSVFVEVLVTGKLSLYRLDDYFLVKKGNEVYSLENIYDDDGEIVNKNKWRGKLSFLISDCLPNSNNAVSHLEFRDKNLIKLVQKYNQCAGEEFKVYKEAKPWTAFKYGISVGMTHSKIRLKDLSSRQNYSHLSKTLTSFDPGFGIVLALTFPRMSENFSFQIEPNYLKSSFGEAILETHRTLKECKATYIDLSTLSIPISVKFTSPLRHFDLFYQVGFVYEYQLQYDTKYIRSTSNHYVVITDEEQEAFQINDTQIGGWIGIGCMKSFQHIKAGVGIKYLLTSYLSGTEFLRANNNKLSFNLILMKK